MLTNEETDGNITRYAAQGGISLPEGNTETGEIIIRRCHDVRNYRNRW
jgi:hypothetical protein